MRNATLGSIIYLDGFSDGTSGDDIVVKLAPLAVAVGVDEDDVVSSVVVARVDEDCVKDVEAEVATVVLAVDLHRLLLVIIVAVVDELVEVQGVGELEPVVELDRGVCDGVVLESHEM